MKGWKIEKHSLRDEIMEHARTLAILVLFAMSMVNTGCTKKENVKPELPVTGIVEPVERTKPSEGLVECAKPGPLEDSSFGAVVRKLSETLGLLDECASKQEQLKNWINEN